jgi:DNA-binding MarR family transcriptional regulator
VTTGNQVEIHQWRSQLERLERSLGRVGPDEVCCEGLTPRQCGILRTLASREGARLSELAAAAGLSPSAMTRVLEKLEKQRLVQRVRGSQRDGRAAAVRITAQGREVRRSIDRLMQERTQAIVAAIPPDARPAVLSALQALAEAMECCSCCGRDAAASLPSQAKEEIRSVYE